MKKGVKRTKLNMKKQRSDNVLRNMLRSLLSSGNVETTYARARGLKRFANSQLNYCFKVNPESELNRVVSRIGDKKLALLALDYIDFAKNQGNEIGTSFASVVRTRYRAGDNSEMAMVALLDFEDFAKEMLEKKPKKKPKKKKKVQKKTKKDKKKEAETKGARKGEKVKPKDEEKKDGFLSKLGGKLLGRKVDAPNVDKTGRARGRSGI